MAAARFGRERDWRPMYRRSSPAVRPRSSTPFLRTPTMATIRPNPAGSRPRFRFVDDIALEDLHPPAWLVDGILPEGGMGLLVGASGEGKTFLALSFALAVATGRPW